MLRQDDGMEPDIPASDEGQILLENKARRFAGAIYGTILATSVLAAAGGDTNALTGTFVIVLVTSLVFWLAHVYSLCLGARMLMTRPLRRDEIRAIASDEWPMLSSSFPILGVLLLGVFGIIEKSTASYVAMFVGIGALFIYGIIAGRGEQLPWTRQVLNTLVIAAFGIAILALKVMVH